MAAVTENGFGFVWRQERHVMDAGGYQQVEIAGNEECGGCGLVLLICGYVYTAGTRRVYVRDGVIGFTGMSFSLSLSLSLSLSFSLSFSNS